tara:strand:+ start:228 stop:683 length:456 start_codon:yes stop_codon:yes gene_type:complete
MKGFYTVLETIKNNLLSDIDVKTVTTGDITKIDLSKQTIFPLSHIMVNNVGNEDNILRFSLSVLSMDIVNVSKEETTNIFRGNDNEQDILNTQLVVLNKLVQVLRGGNLHQDKYQLDGSPSFEPFYDRFENEMAGWALSMDIIIPNEITIC